MHAVCTNVCIHPHVIKYVCGTVCIHVCIWVWKLLAFTVVALSDKTCAKKGRERGREGVFGIFSIDIHHIKDAKVSVCDLAGGRGGIGNGVQPWVTSDFAILFVITCTSFC